ncbi:phenylacetic acid degradation protein PaaD [Prosthecomicrobium hirschii]|uniref:Phenylacetic acid degradation protein PaaD n=1 Tax=Prosthecodimorpha hirschii TaxID=665126 RepID=A0A0P6WDY8_9HYPH|nr:hydroxyphenylacetyl-CoA thioesterase PaaI [Prosthecomicrobium hirschii]KPL52879.1 phenylacetic acid degradation protein PaaD [Prosthecomicrobium hirschii]
MAEKLSPEALARACADLMWAEDKASRGLGMVIDEVGPGRSVLSMTVTEAMVNGHGLCHGGYIFTLADSAFAFACNTYNANTVAAGCQIAYVAPGRLGDRLTARAVERSRSGRSGIYDVTVSRQDGTVLAEFRGNSRTIKGVFLPDQVDGPARA